MQNTECDGTKKLEMSQITEMIIIVPRSRRKSNLWRKGEHWDERFNITPATKMAAIVVVAWWP